MRLVRFGPKNQEKPGVLLPDGSRRDCSSLVADFDSAFWESGGLAALLGAVKTAGRELPLVAEDARWAAPIPRPGKVVCVGLNYSDHAAESGAEVPPEPLLFMKASNTVVGPFDDVLIPKNSKKTDWEVELGIVVGAEARYLESPDQAMQYIGGLTISHDVSEREFQLEHGGQWTKGKSFDTFNPLGPWIATLDEIDDPQNLTLTLAVNGQRRQTGCTRSMVFGVGYLVYYISQVMTLEPGDLINTGTPPGVGLGMKPPVYLRPGDVVELEIAGLGRQRQTLRSC